MELQLKDMIYFYVFLYKDAENKNPVSWRGKISLFIKTFGAKHISDSGEMRKCIGVQKEDKGKKDNRRREPYLSKKG